MKRSILIIILLTLVTLLICEAGEASVKSIVIEKLTHFIDWDKSQDDSEFFKIGYLGNPHFIKDLEELYRKDKFYNKKLVLIENPLLEEMNALNAVIIDKDFRGDITGIVKRAQEIPLLTLSNSEKFVEQGVMINLVRKDGKVSFIINYKEIQKSPLHFSYHLLKMGEIYDK